MSQLQKARLFCTDSSDLDFEFMFNPNQLQIKEALSVGEDKSARTSDGRPKVSFEYPKARTLQLKKIMFDTYEVGKNVLTDYLDKLRESMKFAGYSTGSTTPQTGTTGLRTISAGGTATATTDTTSSRPPIYRFVWGDQNYLLCFVEKLDYKLTMFLPNGTPVRAEVNLSLKEIDESFLASTSRTYDAELFGDRDTRAQPPAPISLDRVNAIEADRLDREGKVLQSAGRKVTDGIVNLKDGKNDLQDAQRTLATLTDEEYAATLSALGLPSNLPRDQAATQITAMSKEDLEAKTKDMSKSGNEKVAQAKDRRSWG